MGKSSYCGADCEACRVRLATVANDDDVKRKVAEDFSKIYKMELKAKNINCKGCKSDTVFLLCELCGVKVCNVGRNTDSCEECPDFKCDRISELLDYQKAADYSGSKS